MSTNSSCTLERRGRLSSDPFALTFVQRELILSYPSSNPVFTEACAQESIYGHLSEEHGVQYVIKPSYSTLSLLKAKHYNNIEESYDNLRIENLLSLVRRR